MICEIIVKIENIKASISKIPDQSRRVSYALAASPVIFLFNSSTELARKKSIPYIRYLIYKQTYLLNPHDNLNYTSIDVSHMPLLNQVK